MQQRTSNGSEMSSSMVDPFPDDRSASRSTAKTSTTSQTDEAEPTYLRFFDPVGVELLVARDGEAVRAAFWVA